MRNLATRSKPDGAALQSVVERFVTGAHAEARERSSAADVVIRERLATLAEMLGGYDFAEVIAILRNAGYRGWLVVEGEQDPAVAPAYRYAEMAYRLLSALVAGKSDAEARAAAMAPARVAT